MTRTRLLAATALVGLLALSAGCAGLFASEVSDERLDEEPDEPYDWNTTTTGTVHVQGDDDYRAVFNLSGTNETKLVLYERGLASDRPEDVRAVRYRYPNGTVVTGSHPAIDVRLEGSRRVIEAPEANGSVAFTGESNIKRFSIRTPVDGSYEVVLPPDRRVSSFLFGRVSPGGYSTSVDDESRLHITWEEVNSPVYVRYYLSRDLLLFRGFVLLLVLVGTGGAAYYLRQIRRLKKRREEVGLDVETEDDDEFDRDPPPGRR